MVDLLVGIGGLISGLANKRVHWKESQIKREWFDNKQGVAWKEEKGIVNSWLNKKFVT